MKKKSIQGALSSLVLVLLVLGCENPVTPSTTSTTTTVADDLTLPTAATGTVLAEQMVFDLARKFASEATALRALSLPGLAAQFQTRLKADQLWYSDRISLIAATLIDEAGKAAKVATSDNDKLRILALTVDYAYGLVGSPSRILGLSPSEFLHDVSVATATAIEAAAVGSPTVKADLVAKIAASRAKVVKGGSTVTYDTTTVKQVLGFDTSGRLTQEDWTFKGTAGGSDWQRLTVRRVKTLTYSGTDAFPATVGVVQYANEAATRKISESLATYTRVVGTSRSLASETSFYWNNSGTDTLAEKLSATETFFGDTGNTKTLKETRYAPDGTLIYATNSVWEQWSGALVSRLATKTRDYTNLSSNVNSVPIGRELWTYTYDTTNPFLNVKTVEQEYSTSGDTLTTSPTRTITSLWSGFVRTAADTWASTIDNETVESTSGARDSSTITTTRNTNGEPVSRTNVGSGTWTDPASGQDRFKTVAVAATFDSSAGAWKETSNVTKRYQGTSASGTLYEVETLTKTYGAEARLTQQTDAFTDGSGAKLRTIVTNYTPSSAGVNQNVSQNTSYDTDARSVNVNGTMYYAHYVTVANTFSDPNTGWSSGSVTKEYSGTTSDPAAQLTEATWTADDMTKGIWWTGKAKYSQLKADSTGRYYYEKSVSTRYQLAGVSKATSVSWVRTAATSYDWANPPPPSAGDTKEDRTNTFSTSGVRTASLYTDATSVSGAWVDQETDTETYNNDVNANYRTARVRTYTYDKTSFNIVYRKDVYAYQGQGSTSYESKRTYYDTNGVKIAEYTYDYPHGLWGDRTVTIKSLGASAKATSVSVATINAFYLQTENQVIPAGATSYRSVGYTRLQDGSVASSIRLDSGAIGTVTWKDVVSFSYTSDSPEYKSYSLRKEYALESGTLRLYDTQITYYGTDDTRTTKLFDVYLLETAQTYSSTSYWMYFKDGASGKSYYYSAKPTEATLTAAVAEYNKGYSGATIDN